MADKSSHSVSYETSKPGLFPDQRIFTAPVEGVYCVRFSDREFNLRLQKDQRVVFDEKDDVLTVFEGRDRILLITNGVIQL